MANLPSTSDNFIFSCLSPVDLHRYSLVNRSGYRRVTYYGSRAFRINSPLSHFFSPTEIITFRHHTGMLISGSTALQFFDRTECPGSDLDLYAEHRHALLIGQWLRRVGYSFVPREGQADSFDEAHEVPQKAGPASIFFSSVYGYFGRGVGGVFNFEKNLPKCKIQLITSVYSPMEIILNFHSTCVMNIISHNTTYSLYPRATFEQRRSLICATEGSKQDQARMKYLSRGWTMEPSLIRWELLDRYSDFRSGNRFVGDKGCWTMNVLPNLNYGPDFVGSNTWEHSYSCDFKAEMQFLLLHSPNMCYSYVLADYDIAEFLVNTFNIRVENSENKYYDDDMKKMMIAYCKESRAFRDNWSVNTQSSKYLSDIAIYFTDKITRSY